MNGKRIGVQAFFAIKWSLLYCLLNSVLFPVMSFVEFRSILFDQSCTHKSIDNVNCLNMIEMFHFTMKNLQKTMQIIILGNLSSENCV
jgi:hypothetical protein